MERAFKDIKDFLQIRPIFHYADRRVRTHVFICFLAYLIEKLIERKVSLTGQKLTGREILNRLEEIKIIENRIDDTQFHSITRISPENSQILESLGVRNIKKLYFS